MLIYCILNAQKGFYCFLFILLPDSHQLLCKVCLCRKFTEKKGPFFIQLAPEAPSGHFPFKGAVPITAPIPTSEAYGTFSNETEDD